MIQRIQTIWLLLAGLCALGTLKLPYYSGIQDPTVNFQELNGMTGGTLTMIVTVVIAVLAFVAIGLYKTRGAQLRLCVIGIILEGLLIYLYYREVVGFTAGNYSLTAVLHLLVIIFFFLAARGINRDEKLIRSTDRLR